MTDKDYIRAVVSYDCQPNLTLAAIFYLILITGYIWILIIVTVTNLKKW